MTDISSEIGVRLSQVRRRWKRLELLKAFCLGMVESLGIVMLLIFADFLYRFPEVVRISLLLA